jgi:phosphoenolpyruvate carboxykinase (GTP)
MLDRIDGTAEAQETPIGLVPTPQSLTLDGLKISREAVEGLLRVDAGDWTAELDGVKEFLAKFGDRLPRELNEEVEQAAKRLHHAGVASR